MSNLKELKQEHISGKSFISFLRKNPNQYWPTGTCAINSWLYDMTESNVSFDFLTIRVRNTGKTFNVPKWMREFLAETDIYEREREYTDVDYEDDEVGNDYTSQDLIGKVEWMQRISDY